MVTIEQVAKRFSECLNKRNLKISEIAKRSKMSRNTISNWCTGASTPNIIDFVNVCKIFDLDINYILGLSDRDSLAYLISNLDYRHREAIELVIIGLIENNV
ncbi:MAG: helix-turn-helix transcriptional regulator [Erysipelotrichaceae bacterium]|uniref:helix-turn-helix domain-containing protein n=1 Tax=Anaerorhabdus sp. TaxID=1872524 RepID=UPI002FC653AF